MESAGRLGLTQPVTTPAENFRYYLRVRYVECDAQKVVFNSRYAEYVDVAINEFLRAIGVLPEFLEDISIFNSSSRRSNGRHRRASIRCWSCRSPRSASARRRLRSARRSALPMRIA